MEHDGNYLCWLRVGTGVVMLGHANVDVHRSTARSTSG